MKKVKLTILESKCRDCLYKVGDEFIVSNTCPPVCIELWNHIYPYVFTLLNGGDLDYGETRKKEFVCSCPDEQRVVIKGEVVED